MRPTAAIEADRRPIYHMTYVWFRKLSSSPSRTTSSFSGNILYPNAIEGVLVVLRDRLDDNDHFLCMHSRAISLLVSRVSASAPVTSPTTFSLALQAAASRAWSRRVSTSVPTTSDVKSKERAHIPIPNTTDDPQGSHRTARYAFLLDRRHPLTIFSQRCDL